jgi:hypothetical protein
MFPSQPGTQAAYKPMTQAGSGKTVFSEADTLD